LIINALHVDVKGEKVFVSMKPLSLPVRYDDSARLARAILEMQTIYANNYCTHTEAVESETNIPECQFLQTLTSLTVLRQTHSLTRHNSNCISDDPIPHFEFRYEYVNVR